MKKVFLMIGIVALISCKKEPEKPGDILTKEQMTQVIIDIHILEAQIKDVKVNFDSSKVIYNLLEKRMFERYGFSDSTYKKSFLYYLDHPRDMEEIYTAVVDSLSLQEKLVR